MEPKMIQLKDGERIDDLQRDGLSIIQNKNGFCFGIDAVLLSYFAKAKRGATIVDLGTGTGIIPLLLSSKTLADKIYGFEIQPDVADMASRSVKLNQLEDRVKIIHGDLKEATSHFTKHTVDVVVSNPPYFASGEALVNPGDYKAISRHEVLCSLDDVVKTASDLLKNGGHFYMVHRPHRLVDILCTMRAHRIEPKTIRFVHPRLDKKPNILLIHGIKEGGAELKFMDPLPVYGDDGDYTEEIYAIYGNVKMDVFDKRGEKDDNR